MPKDITAKYLNKANYVRQTDCKTKCSDAQIHLWCFSNYEILKRNGWLTEKANNTTQLCETIWLTKKQSLINNAIYHHSNCATVRNLDFCMSTSQDFTSNLIWQTNLFVEHLQGSGKKNKVRNNVWQRIAGAKEINEITWETSQKTQSKQEQTWIIRRRVQQGIDANRK